eukprot:511211_1
MSVQIQDEFKEKKNKVVVKVGMLGDSQIGKTTLMVKYIEDKYDEDYIETLGVNFMEKTINLKNVDVTISIWIPQPGDGLHSWSSWMSLVCSDAKVIIFVFDLTNKMSLFSVKRYYKEARRENKCFMPFLVGTKYDLYEENDKEFNIDITRQARKFASKMRSPLIYCSSLAGINVKKIFKLMIAKVFDLKPRMKEVHSIDDAIFEWTKDGNTKEMICIVYGYIRQVKNLYKWKYEIPIEDFSNIVLLFYANVVIGGNNKEYKLESRTHQKVERKNRKEKRKHKKKLKNDEKET